MFMIDCPMIPPTCSPEENSDGLPTESCRACIHTGENGRFAADEFAAITALGQMEFLTPEEIAGNVVREIEGGNTGKDVIAALDASVMGPSFRGGYLRQAALNRLRQLEAEHGESVAFEILGPPRVSKLLYEAHLIESSDTSSCYDRAYAASREWIGTADCFDIGEITAWIP